MVVVWVEEVDCFVVCDVVVGGGYVDVCFGFGYYVGGFEYVVL